MKACGSFSRLREAVLELREYDLSPLEFAALVYIYESDDWISTRIIADLLCCSGAYVTTLAEKWVEMGLVRREHGQDRRTVWYASGDRMPELLDRLQAVHELKDRKEAKP